jgi:hypothetical protein
VNSAVGGGVEGGGRGSVVYVCMYVEWREVGGGVVLWAAVTRGEGVGLFMYVCFLLKY